MGEKIWIVYLGEQAIAIVHAAIDWTVKQIKEWLIRECVDDGYTSEIYLKASS